MSVCVQVSEVDRVLQQSDEVVSTSPGFLEVTA